MNPREISRPINILLAEDNPGDVFIISNCLRDSQVTYNLHHVVDGEKAVEFLHQEGEYCDVALPHLIVLDLNLPKKHGFEVLEEIKANPKLKKIPVIVLSTSRAMRDILTSYNLYANCYVSKPFEINEFMNAIRSLEKFWLNFVQLPSHSDS